MNRTFCFILFLMLGSLSALHSQEQVVCGTSGEIAKELSERLLKNKIHADANPVSLRSTQYVPTKFHLVARNDGSGRPSIQKVLNELCFMNSILAEFDIQLFINDGFNFLNNTAVFNDPIKTENTIMAFNRDRNAMNIFVVGNADFNDDDNSVVLGYYSPFNDLVVINQSQLGGSSKALTHEVGHFFSLLHTHNGWDSEPWTESVGNPAPAIAPDGVPTERMDGSNCENAGDYICDTPPDYNGFGYPSCDYTLGARDPDSVLIDPAEANIMSYFLRGCSPSEFFFSDEQKRLMRADLASSGRNYLRGHSFSPQSIDNAPQLLSPNDGEEAPGGDGTVRLEWTAVAGAKEYIVEVGRVPSFSIQPIQATVTDNFFDASGLEIGRRYFWRVRPFNEYATCPELTSTVQSFTVSQSTAVSTIGFLENWSISPNPVKRDQELYLQLSTSQRFEADLNLFSISGQQVRHLRRERFSSGSNRLAIPVDGLTPGVYLLSLSTEAGRMNQRIVIME